MLVEAHILQNFAPSNLNRDDTGAPKDCIFGGHRRARVSSQCWKRAARVYMQTHDLLPIENRAYRTRLLVSEVVKRLQAELPDIPAERLRPVVATALQAAQLKVDDELKTQYLLFLGEREINAFASVCREHWSELESIATVHDEAASEQTEKGKGKTKKQSKADIPKVIQQKVEALFDGGHAVAVGLFGRMVADQPGLGVDAASQVAHAISVNKVSTDFDYFTAVDDLLSDDETGAGMIGTIEFNSACYYRYASVDVGQLRRNLQSDQELTEKGLTAFLKAFALSVPSGKQNSMAAQSPPSFVMAVVGDAGPWSLANAFVRPISGSGEDLVVGAIKALDGYWGKLEKMYGKGGRAAVATLHPDALTNLKPDGNLDTVIKSVVEAALAP